MTAAEGAPRPVFKSAADIPARMAHGRRAVRLHSGEANDAPANVVTKKSVLPLSLPRFFSREPIVPQTNENFRGVVLYERSAQSFAFQDGLNQEVAVNRIQVTGE